MSNLPLVSCVIIFFNSEAYIEEAIESVLAQTYTNWELWLVDDGSTDGSTAIAQRYAEDYPRQIHYLDHANHANRGKNASRNLGIAHACGKYIALLDSDDVWLSEKLIEQVALLEKHPTAGLLYGRTILWYSWSGEGDAQADALTDVAVVPHRLVQPPELLLHFLADNSQTPATCNAILPRHVFQTVGGFDEAYHDVFEDQAFFVKVALTYPVYVTDRVWAKYRKHATSSLVQFLNACEGNRALQDATALKLLRWIERYLKQQQIQERSVWQALRRQIHLRQRRLWLRRLPFGQFVINVYVSLKFRLWKPLVGIVQRLRFA